jgi:hypothetical protein
MKFQVGDKILVKQTLEEGEVLSVLPDNMAVVRVNKVSFPIDQNEIDHPYLYWFTNNKIKPSTSSKKYIEQVPREKPKPKEVMGGYGMNLIFLPIYRTNTSDDIIEKVKIFLSNNQELDYAFSYRFKAKAGESFTIDSEIFAYNDFYIHDISYEDLATNPAFTITCAEIISNINSGLSQFDDTISLKPKKLMELLNEMLEKENAYFQVPLFNAAPFVPETLDVKPYTAPAAAPRKKTFLEIPIILPPTKIVDKKPEPIPAYLQNPGEIDLHIENLHDKSKEFAKGEILQLQLDAFQKALDNAILQGLPSLFVIHGVGKGLLKQKIHALLNQTKQVHSYVNEYDPKYGFGSTKVNFQL